jgi:hypothetical protein
MVERPPVINLKMPGFPDTERIFSNSVFITKIKFGGKYRLTQSSKRRNKGIVEKLTITALQRGYRSTTVFQSIHPSCDNTKYAIRW